MPRDFDIFSPDAMTRKPCTKTLFGVLRSEKRSIAGQNSVWKYTMSLPMKWYCSTSADAMNWSNVRVSPGYARRAAPESKCFFSAAR